MIRRLVIEEDGQTLVEYGLLVSLIAIVAIAILAVLGRKARDVFVQVNTRLTSTA
jgi:pilus assembly protein Flp/PilA